MKGRVTTMRLTEDQVLDLFQQARRSTFARRRCYALLAAMDHPKQPECGGRIFTANASKLLIRRMKEFARKYITESAIRAAKALIPRPRGQTK